MGRPHPRLRVDRSPADRGPPGPHARLRARRGGPTVYFLAATIAAGVTFVLMMVVMRGLLESAVLDRTELDAVI